MPTWLECGLRRPGDADSNFASWQVQDASKPWIARYRYELPHGGTYTVHVGCGQKPENPNEWVNEDWSKNPVSGPLNSFTCDDPTAGASIGICRQVSG